MTPRWFAFFFTILLLAAPAGAQVKKSPILKNKAAREAKKARLVERFNKMAPEDRQRVLKRLPEDRREELEKNRERYNKLSDEQKKRLERQYGNFAQMPREQQESVRMSFRQMSQLPVERRQALQRELRRLRMMDPGERKARIQSGEYKSAYSPEEQKILEQLNVLVPQR